MTSCIARTGWEAALVAVTMIGITMAALSAPVRAQEGTTAAFGETFRDWMRRHGVSRGLLGVARHGRLAHATGVGMPADAAVPTASLSKAVTAVCIATLIQEGRLSFDTHLDQALARTFQRLGAPADPRLRDVTIAQLLSHRAGYRAGDDQPDPANAGLAAYLRTQSATKPAIDEQVQALLRATLAVPPGEHFAYTNAAYLLLGAVIEETTGTPYESHCRSAVLAPTGNPDVGLTPGWRVTSSYGGWQFTAAQYLRFHEVFGPQGPVLTAATRPWLLSPDGKSVGGGVHYGLGTFVRQAAGSHNFWHAGRWRFQFSGGPDGTLSIHYGTYVARLGAPGFTWFAYFEPPPPDSALGELDRRMGEAGMSVERWP